jgi:hypothetical protein
MIDLSSSMTGRRFDELRATLTEFVQQMMRTNSDKWSGAAGVRAVCLSS